MAKNVLREDAKEAKEKLRRWLVEEGILVGEVADPKTLFKFRIRMGGAGLVVVQDSRSQDSITVGGTLAFNQRQLGMLEAMSEKVRRDFFWELPMALLHMPELGGFQLRPNPSSVRQITVVSKKRLRRAV